MDENKSLLEQPNYIKDDKKYFIGKDTDGVSRTTKEFHAILMKIVLEVDRICRKNDIPYALSFGSALGLYNYGGIIPWDDDIDISIDYFDIPRFVEALKNDLGEEFSFDCYENNKRYNVIIPTMKIRLKQSYIKEANCYTLPNRCKNGNGIFVDVVAFMGVPENPKEHSKLIKYSKRKMPFYVFFDGFLRIHPYGMKKRLKGFEKKIAEQFRDSPQVSQTVIIPFQDWGNEKDKLSYPRDVLYPVKEYEFEGHKLYSYQNVEEFCRLCYGKKSLRKFDGEKWIDPYPNKRKKAGHIRAFNLNKKIK